MINSDKWLDSLPIGKKNLEGEKNLTDPKIWINTLPNTVLLLNYVKSNKTAKSTKKLLCTTFFVILNSNKLRIKFKSGFKTNINTCLSCASCNMC